MKRTVLIGPLRATLSQLQSGAHAGKWKITYHDIDGVMRIGGVFISEAKAKRRAMEILHAMLDDRVENLTPEESRLIRQMRADSISPESLAPLLADLAQIEAMGASECVALFLAREVDDENYSYEQRGDYYRVLTEFSEKFGSKVMSGITLDRLEKWVDSWKIGAKRFNNKLTILNSFWKWAHTRGYVRKNEAAGIRRKRISKKSSHDVYTPAEFAKLLIACPEPYLPWLALSGFAGLRGAEIYGRPDDRSSGLHWKDVHWGEKTIVLRQESAKETRGARARPIPLCAALADWLSPWREAGASGPVHPIDMPRPHNGNNSITSQLGTVIGGWKSNALRASRASYRLAETESLDTVTVEMGHCKDMLLGNYLNPRFKSDAAIWFALDREAAENFRLTVAG